MGFLEKIPSSEKICISCIKWRAGRYGKSEKWQNIRAVNCCLKCVPYENYSAQQFLSPNKKTPMRAVKSKKEMTLDCPSFDASRVISVRSWVQSLVNLLFCGLARLSVTNFELLPWHSFFPDYSHLHHLWTDWIWKPCLWIFAGPV